MKDFTNTVNELLIDKNIIPSEISNLDSDTIQTQDNGKGPYLNLFYSFDIVNSTRFKSITKDWVFVLKGLLREIKVQVEKIEVLSDSILWRIIGDELVFVKDVRVKDQLPLYVDAIFELTQHLDNFLKDGSYLRSLSDELHSTIEDEQLEKLNFLSVKTTAWIGVLNDKQTSSYDNIYFQYKCNENYQSYRYLEFLGLDIDTGFRLKEYTIHKRMVLSFELAFLLSEYCPQYLHIIDYVKLKGVWNDNYYPIIWYYNPIIVQLETKSETPISFLQSFSYDDFDNYSILEHLRQRKQCGLFVEQNGIDNETLANEKSNFMYEVPYALDKILKDRNLDEKINYINQTICAKFDLRNNPLKYEGLELHCAVVCCDVKNRKVFITKRKSNVKTNPGKWEFGCAKIGPDSPLKTCIIDYYKKVYNLEIELLVDNLRNEKQPKPYAIYEVDNKLNKKGILFIAKVINSSLDSKEPQDDNHDIIKWITADDIEQFTSYNSVNDFKNTLSYVFNNFDILFV